MTSVTSAVERFRVRDQGQLRVRVAYFVPPSGHFAGIERVVHELATGLMDGHGDVMDVHVLFCSKYNEEMLTATKYQLHVLGVERLRGLAASLRSIVRELNVDVLVCPQVEASVIGWVATRGLGLPVFMPHLHGNPRLEEADGSRSTRAAFAVFRHLVSRRVPGVLTVSPSLRDYAATAVAPHTDVYFAKNPVREMAPLPRLVDPDVFRFVNVARLSHQKGQDILLRALARARPDLPPTTLTLVGSGPDEADLRKLSTTLGLDDIVEFTGYTSEPARYLAAADCFVLSSRWEGFGMVMLEALQFGLPLLATDCEFGPADLITDRRIGNLVPVDDVAAMARGLIAASSRTSTLDDETYRHTVAAEYGRTDAAAMHFNVLRTLLATKPAIRARLS